jgi:hypothetical protein
MTAGDDLLTDRSRCHADGQSPSICVICCFPTGRRAAFRIPNSEFTEGWAGGNSSFLILPYSLQQVLPYAPWRVELFASVCHCF